MNKMNESMVGKVKKTSIKPEVPILAADFIYAVRKYIEEQNLITSSKGIIMDEDEKFPKNVVCSWRHTNDPNQQQINQSDTNLRLDVVVYPFSYYKQENNGRGEIPALDISFVVNCPMKLKGWKDDKVSIHLGVNCQKRDIVYKKKLSYLIQGTEYELTKDGQWLDVWEMYDGINVDLEKIQKLTIEKCSLDCNPKNLSFAKSIVDNIKKFLENKTYKNLVQKEKMSNGFKEIEIKEQVKSITGAEVPYDEKILTESIVQKVKKTSVSDIENKIDNEINNPKIGAEDFVRQLNDFILTYKVDWMTTNGKRFQPYRFLPFEWELLRVWSNEFAIRLDNNGILTLCFDVCNSKKGKMRIKFICQTMKYDYHVKNGVKKYDEPRIVSYFELNDFDKLYQYTNYNRKGGKCLPIDTKTGLRLSEKNENNGLLWSDTKTFNAIKKDIQYFLEHWKDLYKNYLKEDWNIVWEKFYRNLPSIKGDSLTESMVGKIKSVDSKSIERTIDNNIENEIDFNRFNELMNGFVPDIKSKYKNIFFTPYPFKFSTKETNSLRYRVVKSVVCKFPERVVGRYMNTDRTRILFDVDMHQYGISYWDKEGYEDLNTPIGIFTIDFFIRLGHSNQPQQFMFSSLELNDDDFVIGEMRERREWEKPNMCRSLAYNYKRFIDALAKTVYDMPKNVWSEIGEVSSHFTPMAGEACCKIDGDKVDDVLKNNGFYEKLHQYYKDGVNESMVGRIKKNVDFNSEVDEKVIGYPILVKKMIEKYGLSTLYKNFLNCPIRKNNGEYIQSSVFFKEFKSDVTNKIKYLSLGELEIPDDSNKIYCCWRNYTQGSSVHYLACKTIFSEMNEKDQKDIYDYLVKRFGGVNESIVGHIQKGFDFDSTVDTEAIDFEDDIKKILLKFGKKLGDGFYYLNIINQSMNINGLSRLNIISDKNFLNGAVYIEGFQTVSGNTLKRGEKINDLSLEDKKKLYKWLTEYYCVKESMISQIKNNTSDDLDKIADKNTEIDFDTEIGKYIKKFGETYNFKQKGLNYAILLEDFDLVIMDNMCVFLLYYNKDFDNKVELWCKFKSNETFMISGKKWEIPLSNISDKDKMEILQYFEKKFGNISESMVKKVSKGFDFDSQVDSEMVDYNSLIGEIIEEEGDLVNWFGGGQKHFVLIPKYAKDDSVPVSEIKANLRNSFILDKNDVSYLIVTWVIKSVDNNDIKLITERFTKKGYRFNRSREEYDFSELTNEQQKQFYLYISDKKHIVSKKED